MKYFSLNHNSQDVSFLDAVRKGLAPDRGLYFPNEIPKLPEVFYNNIKNFSNHDIAFQVIKPFVGDDIPVDSLRKIVEDTLNFDFPIVPITETMATLELFQGPTLAFKDVGARFMARCLSYANEVKKTDKLTILVATSGDTGGAVADGFYKVEGIQVVILYPKGKVSEIQEKQLTTLGENITAIEVNGTFDDCQDMVKSAFIDADLIRSMPLTSANSINIARWLSQMFYYFIAFKNRITPDKKLAVSVPSGNFGNICAGLVAKEMGLPIDQFIASTNINDTVPDYLNSGTYSPKKSKPTLSNAMDVGDPSNFIRIQKLFNNDIFKLKKILKGYHYTDSQTKKAIKEIYEISGYIADPHGAIGYLGLKEFLESTSDAYQGLFFETAHPIKFVETVENTLKTSIEVPERLKGILNRKKESVSIQTYEQLKSFLLES
ncbi:MAG: threonine synthase [Flavobacteriaceae bacterium]|jgi:threonine synthase|nr:threonine synthase [Flavobacteriaceae bacterium]MBT5091332.1 threonine synthase [Flavobacteriaceae bacterium]MBT5284189.1 threonine synthase [Flavobacteriaceae bacterium]MBT5445845.1 threonine synthase [Flavobacteriaceae bacterium]MBT6953064.1 threonine synthase [Flavobacteriaceae bacterium]